MNFFKREAKAIAAETDSLAIDLEHAIAADLKGLGRSVVGLIHHDILDHAADTVASLKAKAEDEISKIEARIKEIGAEASDLAEKRRRTLAVKSMVENGLRDLEAATDAKADAQPQAPVDTVVDAALSPAAE